MQAHQKGFTLIELLVVIAIIGLLSSVILASLSNARNLAQNVRRENDIHQYIVALEQYNVDNNGYPNPNPDINTTQNFCLGPRTSNPCNSYSTSALLNTALQKYMANLPIDTKIARVGINGYVYSCDSLDTTRCKDFSINWYEENYDAPCAGGTKFNVTGYNLTSCTVTKYYNK